MTITSTTSSPGLFPQKMGGALCNKQRKRKKNKTKPTDKRDKTNKRKKNGTVLLGILVGDVPPGSPDPDPISDLKMYFTAPVLSDL